MLSLRVGKFPNADDSLLFELDVETTGGVDPDADGATGATDETADAVGGVDESAACAEEEVGGVGTAGVEDDADDGTVSSE